MKNQEFALVSIDVEEPELSLKEVCTVLNLSTPFVEELIEYGAIEPLGSSNKNWRFNAYHLRRLHRIKRVHEQLEANLPGAVLAVDLMEEIERLQSQVELLEKHLLSSRIKF